MFKFVMRENELADFILKTVVNALNDVSENGNLFYNLQGNNTVTEGNFGNRALSIPRLQIDYGKEISCLHNRIDTQIKHFNKLSRELALLMNHLKLEFEMIDEMPSIPEHIIIVKKKRIKK